MFAEVKSMLPVSGDGYDSDIIIQIKAAVADLTKTEQIVLNGIVNISRIWHDPVITTESEEPGYWEIVDNSTLTDEYAITAIGTWCNMHIGNPPNYDNLSKAYHTMKGNMRMSKAYKAAPEEEGT